VFWHTVAQRLQAGIRKDHEVCHVQSAAPQIASAVSNARPARPRPPLPNGSPAVPFTAIMDDAAPNDPPPAPRQDAPPAPTNSSAPAASAPAAAKPAKQNDKAPADQKQASTPDDAPTNTDDPASADQAAATIRV
jgi:hypothetical protein